MSKSNLGKNNRRKGHVYETQVAKLFRDVGYDFCKTSRQASRLLDDCKIDLAFIPYNVQCKKGYKNRRPKAEEIFKEIKEALSKNFPKNSPEHNYPNLLFQSFNTTHLVTMDVETAMELIRIKRLYDESTEN